MMCQDCIETKRLLDKITKKRDNVSFAVGVVVIACFTNLQTTTKSHASKKLNVFSWWYENLKQIEKHYIHIP